MPPKVGIQSTSDPVADCRERCLKLILCGLQVLQDRESELLGDLVHEVSGFFRSQSVRPE